MAVTLEIRGPTGVSLSVRVYPYGSDTPANTSLQAMTEATNRKGIYTVDLVSDDPLVGWYTAHVYNNTSSSYIGVYDVFLEDAAGIYRAEDAPISAHTREGIRIQPGTGDGQLDVTAGKLAVNLVQANGETGPILRFSAFFGSLKVFNVISGSTTLECRTDLTEADNFWNGATLMFTSGALQNVVRLVTAYDQTNGAFTLDEALPSAPVAAVTGIILGRITT